MTLLIFSHNSIIGKKISKLFTNILTNNSFSKYDFSTVLNVIFVKNEKDIWKAMHLFNIDLLIMNLAFDPKVERIKELAVKIKKEHPEMNIFLVTLEIEEIINKKEFEDVLPSLQKNILNN